MRSVRTRATRTALRGGRRRRRRRHVARSPLHRFHVQRVLPHPRLLRPVRVLMHRAHDGVRSQLRAQPLERRVGGADVAPRGAQQIALLAGERRRRGDRHAHRAHRRGERPPVEQRAAALEQRRDARERTRGTHLARHRVHGLRHERAARVVERERDRDRGRGAPVRDQLLHQPIERGAHEEQHRFHRRRRRRELHLHRGLRLDAREHGAPQVVGAREPPRTDARDRPTAAPRPPPRARRAPPPCGDRARGAPTRSSSSIGTRASGAGAR